MKPLKAAEIKGNWATLLLPINKNGSIDYHSLGEEIDILIQSGVNGVYSNGTAGEFYNQTEREFDKISELLASKCKTASMPFQIGCSHMSPAISRERLKRVKQLKPSALQVILPDWWKPSDEEIIRYLRVMEEDAGSIGLILYNPPHAKKQLVPDDFEWIRTSGITLIGCKVAGGDDSWYASMREKMAHLSVFIPGHFLATGINEGAQGAYSNVSCINPRASQQWYELMTTDMQAARNQEKRIQRFLREYVQPYLKDGRYSNQAADKFMAAVGGWASISPKLRWPYSSIPTADVAKVRAAAIALIPEFFGKFSNV